ncbi:hypothetical protein NMG60_11009205 [Bertholletia excelsa]
MAMVTLTSGCNISQELSFESNDRLRYASFSSYLPCCEEAFATKFPDPSQDLNTSTIKSHKHRLLLGRKKEEGEIGVFTAEKYFNGGIDGESPKIADNGTINSHPVTDEPPHASPAKPKLKEGTCSIQSESSWNSHNALLQNPPKRKASSRQKLSKKSLLASFGCNCYCSDKNSVDIDEQAREPESNPNRSSSCGVLQGKAVLTKDHVMNIWNTGNLAPNKSRTSPWAMEEFHCKKIDDRGLRLDREECFNFPTMSSKPANNLTVKVHLREEEQDEKQRKSLEVFGSPVIPNKKSSASLENRVNILPWEGNDIESDASSDLFEIESCPANSNSSPFLLGQASGGLSSCVTPRTCYPPSEASIEWSVVTASAADCSVVSDCEDRFSSSGLKKPQKLPPKEAEKRRSGILAGCKSQKAVTVAEFAYRTSGKEVSNPRTRETMFQAKPQLTGFVPGSLTRSRSERIPHPFYV